MTRIELPRAGRIEEAVAGGRRRRRNELMVTPTESLIHNDPYIGRQVMEPGRYFISVDHSMVRQHPELFVPARKNDRITADRMRDFLQRAEKEELRAIERMRRGSAPRRRGAWRLPDAPRAAWKLP
jgi:hypothetical protein